MRRHRILAVVSGLAAFAAVGVLWFLFAPAGLGGRVDYAVVYGSSMEPTLHRGDLVVLHRRSSYGVGEVVGYRNPDLRRVVLHRIVGEQGGRFLLKGDNNGFTDSFRTPPDRIVGGLWLRVPVVGNAFTWLRAPLHALLAFGLLALLLVGGGGARAQRRRPRRLPHWGGEAARPLVAAGAAGVALFGGLALLAAAHAQTRPVADGNAYTQRVGYRYSGTTPSGPVYPTGRVRTGDTVFRQLVHRLTLTANYGFSSTLAHDVHGTARFDATLRSQQGFTRALPLVGKASFSGDRWHASGTLDLVRLRKAITAYEHTTGVVGDAYTVDVAARFDVRGVVGGQRVHDSFAPTPVSFALDATKLRLLLPEQPEAPDPLHATASGSLTHSAPATLGLGRLRASVPRARMAGIVGAGVGALVAALGLLLLVRGEAGDEIAQIRRRHGSWLVEVTALPGAASVVELTSVASLARLAEYYERAILHHVDGAVHTFAIERDGTLYRVRVGAEVHQLERPTATLRRESL